MPLSYYAMRGQATQARLAPELQELRRRYASQPDRLRTEMTALYQREGTAMLAGCLPAWMLASTPPPAAGNASRQAAPQAGAVTAAARLMPYLTVAMAAFVPLAAWLYLVTTTAWTLAERAILRRRARGQPPPP